MKSKIFAGILLVAAAYLASAYNVEIKVTENNASACIPGDPGCAN